jgi:hypothetical protein
MSVVLSLETEGLISLMVMPVLLRARPVFLLGKMKCTIKSFDPRYLQNRVEKMN